MTQERKYVYATDVRKVYGDLEASYKRLVLEDEGEMRLIEEEVENGLRTAFPGLSEEAFEGFREKMMAHFLEHIGETTEYERYVCSLDDQVNEDLDENAESVDERAKCRYSAKGLDEIGIRVERDSLKELLSDLTFGELIDIYSENGKTYSERVDGYVMEIKRISEDGTESDFDIAKEFGESK